MSARAILIYEKAGKTRAVQPLLGHTKLNSAMCYLGAEVEDPLMFYEGIDV